MRFNFKEKFNKLLDNIFVNDFKCIVCGKEILRNSRYSMCKDCLAKLPYIKKYCEKCGESIVSGNLCLNCKRELPKITQNFSVFDYSKPINYLITNLKYDNKKYIANYLSNFLVDKFIESNIKVDFVIPVPISENRLKIRGFNQAELLCSAFNEKLNMEVCPNLVSRIVDTISQTSLSRKERLTNLTNTFKVNDKNKIKGKSILIVDDVYTTGATINEIAKVLFKAKAKNVYGLTVAHSVNNVLMEETLKE